MKLQTNSIRFFYSPHQGHGSLKGGEWIIKDSNAFETFIPEDFNEEQLMVMDMCHQFLHTEIDPIL
ncbi:MAG: hypothetical protein H7101_04740, partial [Deinococcales bacterium]|nr:hypothetical protein [Chitinophagaceae bacterium]